MFDILENIPSLGFFYSLVLKMSLSRELMMSELNDSGTSEKRGHCT